MTLVIGDPKTWPAQIVDPLGVPDGNYQMTALSPEADMVRNGSDVRSGLSSPSPTRSMQKSYVRISLDTSSTVFQEADVKAASTDRYCLGAIKGETMDGDQGEDIVQVFSSDVRFQCPACPAFVETRMEVPEPNWTAAEDLSELYSEDISHVLCPNCGNEFEVYVYFTRSECTASFQEFSDATIDVDEPMYWPPGYEWTDPGKTPDPYAVYDQTYQQLRELVMNFGEAGGHSIINRMIFAQHVSAMEAYLCDKLVNEVSDNSEVLLKLISADPALQKAKFSLADVAKGEDVAKTYVIGHLKALLYHNLEKVDSLYRSGLGLSILANGDDTKALLAAVKLRHDCVHRNGFDTEGNPPTAFTQDYVRQTAEVIKRLVDRVDTSVCEF